MSVTPCSLLFLLNEMRGSRGLAVDERNGTRPDETPLNRKKEAVLASSQSSVSNLQLAISRLSRFRLPFQPPLRPLEAVTKRDCWPGEICLMASTNYR